MVQGYSGMVTVVAEDELCWSLPVLRAGATLGLTWFLKRATHRKSNGFFEKGNPPHRSCELVLFSVDVCKIGSTVASCFSARTTLKCCGVKCCLISSHGLCSAHGSFHTLWHDASNTLWHSPRGQQLRAVHVQLFSRLKN